MRLKLKDFFASICKDVVLGARAGTVAAVQAAEDSEELTVDIPIGGQPLRVEGASNLPPRILLARSVSIKTQGYISLDDENEPIVTLKKGLFEKAPEIEIEMEFERSRPLESLEMVRDRGNEMNKSWIELHRAQIAVAKQKVLEEHQTKQEEEAKKTTAPKPKAKAKPAAKRTTTTRARSKPKGKNE